MNAANSDRAKLTYGELWDAIRARDASINDFFAVLAEEEREHGDVYDVFKRLRATLRRPTAAALRQSPSPAAGEAFTFANICTASEIEKERLTRKAVARARTAVAATDCEMAFIEACDEAGCAYDNEALLTAIANLKRAAARGGAA